MRHFLNIDDIAQARGETTFKVARLLTRKECKLYLCFGGGKEKLLCITEQMIDGYYHLFQGKKGDYPMTLKSQHECVQRLSNNNFDLSGLSFMVGKDELRLKSVDGEDRSVFVGAKKFDIDLLSPLSTHQTAPGSMYPVPPEKKIFEKFEKIKIPNKRKPHSAFVVVAKTMMKIKRGEAWKELVDLAQKSRGQTEVTLSGWGKIYLRRVRLNPEQEILYSHEQFDYDKTEKLT